MNEPDRIVCVNLDLRADRWAAFRRQAAASSVLAGRVGRFSARSPADTVRPSWWRDGHGDRAARRSDPTYACRQSHLDVWHRAILDGVQHLLVFEDDAVLAAGFDAAVGLLYAELPPDWLGYFLGGYAETESASFSANCVRHRGSFGTHAYGLSAAGLRRAYDHVVYWTRGHDGEGVTIDWSLRDLCGRDERTGFYAPPAWLAWQADGYSDIDCGFVRQSAATGGPTLVTETTGGA